MIGYSVETRLIASLRRNEIASLRQRLIGPLRRNSQKHHPTGTFRADFVLYLVDVYDSKGFTYSFVAQPAGILRGYPGL